MTNQNKTIKEIENLMLYRDEAMEQGKLKEILDQALTTAIEQAREEAIRECINALPLRSDWDDDEKVSAQMVIDTAREALNSFLTPKEQVEEIPQFKGTQEALDKINTTPKEQ